MVYISVYLRVSKVIDIEGIKPYDVITWYQKISLFNAFSGSQSGSQDWIDER